MRPTIPLLFCLSLAATAQEPDKKPEPAAKEEKQAEKVQAPVIKESSVEIDGKKIPYKVTTGKIQLKQDNGKARASVFHVTYERSDVKDASKRPVMFAFNGGPGSSAVWLHIGALGPKIIQLPGDGTTAPAPPAQVGDNPLSILDVCDLVFIDPVSTGYSRAENDAKPGDFHGLTEDIESVGDFIRRWISEHDRWSSPKYLLGESYGGIRAAGLSQHLQSRYGMSLNGVVLLSSLLDFATLQSPAGNDLSHLVYLPAFTGTAHFHKKITGDRDELVRQSTEFAFGEYASALLKGNALDEESRKALAVKLAGFTGIDAEVWLERNLRVDPSFFRGELLRKEGKVLGRFDARVAWDATDKSAPTPEYDPSYSLAYGAFSTAMMDYLGRELAWKEDQPYEILTGKVLGRFDARVAWDATDKSAPVPEYDPSYSLAYGAFSTAMMDYLGRELGWKEDQPYEILTGKVQPWKWNANNSVVSVAGNLATAMRDNPHLRVLVMGGHTDLATPPEGVAYSVRHMLDLPAAAKDNFTTTYYDGGHMFYLNPPDLAKGRKDLVKFIQAGTP